MKLLTFIIIGLLLFSFLFIYHFIDDKMKQYQGPVPEGYDEEHFRKTGVTKPEEKVDIIKDLMEKFEYFKRLIKI